MSTTAAETVEKLKREGNAFFLQKSYIYAAEKYTEALKIDKDNAILYSNHSAWRLNLKAYVFSSPMLFLQLSFLLRHSTGMNQIS
ncbi:hypothetical protein EV368DRAFT_53508 [Lentinula lateritia]|nr:hypothetical protein EV368DRAFT_53508 [Lentinula lateritia]